MATTKKDNRKVRTETTPITLVELQEYDLTKWVLLDGTDWLQVKVFANREVRWFGLRIKGYHDTRIVFEHWQDFCEMVRGYRALYRGAKAKKIHHKYTRVVDGLPLWLGQTGDSEYPWGVQVGSYGQYFAEKKSELMTWLKPLADYFSE